LEELTSENTYRDKCWPDLKPGVNDDDIKYGRKYITTGPAVKHFFPDFRMFIQFFVGSAGGLNIELDGRVDCS